MANNNNNTQLNSTLRLNNVALAAANGNTSGKRPNASTGEGPQKRQKKGADKGNRFSCIEFDGITGETIARYRTSCEAARALTEPGTDERSRKKIQNAIENAMAGTTKVPVLGRYFFRRANGSGLDEDPNAGSIVNHPEAENKISRSHVPITQFCAVTGKRLASYRNMHTAARALSHPGADDKEIKRLNNAINADVRGTTKLAVLGRYHFRRLERPVPRTMDNVRLPNATGPQHFATAKQSASESMRVDDDDEDKISNEQGDTEERGVSGTSEKESLPTVDDAKPSGEHVDDASDGDDRLDQPVLDSMLQDSTMRQEQLVSETIPGDQSAKEPPPATSAEKPDEIQDEASNHLQEQEENHCAKLDDEDKGATSGND